MHNDEIYWEKLMAKRDRLSEKVGRQVGIGGPNKLVIVLQNPISTSKFPKEFEGCTVECKVVGVAKA